MEQYEAIQHDLHAFAIYHVESRQVHNVPSPRPIWQEYHAEQLLPSCEEGDTSNPPLYRALVARNKAIVTLFVDTGIQLK